VAGFAIGYPGTAPFSPQPLKGQATKLKSLVHCFHFVTKIFGFPHNTKSIPPQALQGRRSIKIAKTTSGRFRYSLRRDHSCLFGRSSTSIRRLGDQIKIPGSLLPLCSKYQFVPDSLKSIAFKFDKKYEDMTRDLSVRYSSINIFPRDFNSNDK